MIRILLVTLFAVSVLARAASDQPTRPTPVVHAIDPATAKAGDQLIASGENLGKEVVAEVYLTQGDATFKVAVKAQTSDSITFLVPPQLKAGRFGLTILKQGTVPVLIDEPVVVTIE